jgi:hypothetical protein
VLLAGLVDYAGLFPPASQDMRAALESYASYVESPDRRALGRFIVPLSRLTELEKAGTDLMPRGKRSTPWRLSVLVSEDVRDAAEEMLKFNRRHGAGSKGGHAVIDVVELKATTPNEIDHQRRDLPGSFITYFESPLAADVTPLINELAHVGARAKIRTGGVASGAFPPAQAIIDFMTACQRGGVAFKATAGLHHPIRGEYRFTYEPDSASGYMYGYVNVFLAAALIHRGEPEAVALAALEETDASAFRFEPVAIVWRDKRVTVDQLQRTRSEFAIAFGSCSFREPVDELANLTRSAGASDT